MMNTLYYGDNLTIMQEKMGRLGMVDLIYLDPPFKSDAGYNLLYHKYTERPVPEQAEAFKDTWELDAAKRELAKSMPVFMRAHKIPPYFIEFWRLWMHGLADANPQLLAYLTYMVQRLILLQGILKPTGSIYLHCDPTASHYIKVMMDAIFGHNNFRNEIVWKRTGSHGGSKRWGPIHDVIFFYTMSDKYTWNRTFQKYDPEYMRDYYREKDERGAFQLVSLTGAGVRTGESGKAWRGVDPTGTGRHWAVPLRALRAAYPDKDLAGLSTQEKLDLLDEAGLVYWPERGSVPRQKRYSDENPGVPIQDIITDIGPLSSHSEERLGYQTQKPTPLLDRIIQASSNPGEVVFDPFCGCGTTMYSAVKNNRKWIGCDIAILPIRLVRERLTEVYRQVEGVNFVVDGIPVSVEQAQELAQRDPMQFQHWFVERVDGFPMQKKVADRGIDGRIYFETIERGKSVLREAILSVKGGHLRPSDVRDLRGVMEREGAPMAALLTMKEPTKAMKQEAASAGLYEYNGLRYERLQILTVRDVLEGKRTVQAPSKMGSRMATAGQAAMAL
ncbi:MAG: site-specific DNA-methyltransferase [Rhizomicrobium sp.]